MVQSLISFMKSVSGLFLGYRVIKVLSKAQQQAPPGLLTPQLGTMHLLHVHQAQMAILHHQQ